MKLNDTIQAFHDKDMYGVTLVIVWLLWLAWAGFYATSTSGKEEQ